MKVTRLFLKGVKEIYIISCYRPPTGQIDGFIQNLENIIVNLSNRINIEIIIIDININLNKRNDIGVRKYKEFMKRHGLQNLIEYDTNVTGNNGSSRIDHILTTDPDLYAQHAYAH